MISLSGVSFSYGTGQALDRISLNIVKGENVAIIGPNASGKTTLAMVMNALIVPSGGHCIVDGVDTRDDPMHARRAVGMVFQDPESQVIARRVRDDIAFGPMNLGLPDDDVEKRVRESLDLVGLGSFIQREVPCLSGGQKQLLAVAGVLAMRPSYIVFDEPTALLDGPGRRMVHNALGDLKKKGIGVIMITHDMEEALAADRIVALAKGRVVADMPPSALFSDTALMGRIGIVPPYSYELAKYAGATEVTRECR